MRVLIFGGSGFLGRNLANYLSNLNHIVTIFDKRNTLKKNSKIKFIKGNILNFKKV